MYMYDRPAIILQNFRNKIYGRGKKLLVADTFDKILYQFWSNLWINALYRPIIENTQENIPAKTIQKRADCLVCIALNSIPTAFEFDSNRFPNAEYFFQC